MSKESDDSVVPGDHVRITGIESTPELNGQTCTVLRPGENGRWVVSTQQGEKSLRPQNLLVVRADAALARHIWRAMGCALVLTMSVVIGAGRSTRLTAAIPVIAILWLLGTLGSCYELSRPLRQSGVVVPAISEMGVAQPARNVYRAGFATVGLLLAWTMYLYDVILMARLTTPGPEDTTAALPGRSTLYGYLAAAGVFVQGVLTLEESLSLQCLLHFGGAIVFMLGTMQHAAASTSLLGGPRGAELVSAYPLVLRAIAVRRVCSEYGPMALMLLPLGMQFLKRASPAAEESSAGAGGSASMQNAMGAAQWALVLNFSFFFCTYAYDFWLVAQ